MIKRLKKEPEKKEPEKKEPEEKIKKTLTFKKSKKVEEEKKELPEQKKEVENVLPPKKIYAGVGLVGSHDEINKFRGMVKMKGLVIGEELVSLLKSWNEKNKQ